MGQIKQWMKQLNLRKKLLILFVILILFPLSLQGIVTYQKFSHTMDKKTEQYTVDIVLQINTNLDRMLKDLQRLSLMPLYDEKVLSILKKYDGEMGSAVWASSEDYQKMKLYTSGHANNRVEIRGVHLISNSGIFFSNVDAMALASVWDSKEDRWFEEVRQSDGEWVLIPQHQPSYYIGKITEPYISVARVIREPNTLDRIGFIIIDVKLSVFRAILSNLNFESNANLMIVDSKKRLLFENNLGDNFPAYSDLFRRDFQPRRNTTHKIDVGGNTYMLVENRSSYSGLSVIGLIPTDTIQKESRELRKFTLWFAVLCVIVVTFLSIMVSYKLTRPLVELKHNMIRVEQGDFSQRVHLINNDELGQLGRGFNKMMEEIDRLFKEVFLLGIREKEAELAALQSQIQPHFIYNTLESISMLAIQKNANEVSDMVSALGSLLRYTIDKADRLVPLKEELYFIKSYVHIQQMRYAGRLRVEYEIDEHVEHILIPKLTIQPLVENAIYHGIEPGAERGTIWIFATRFENELLITVRDNGEGLTEEELEELNRKIRT